MQMNRRLVATVVAVVLALVGAALLASYVSGADRRAMADMDPVEVLVVTEPVFEGTPSEQLGELVDTDTLPAASVGPGAVTDLTELGGLVATTDLEPGEQLLAHRFADPDARTTAGEIPAPPGLHEVSVMLDSPRVMGGTVTPGATVGVFISMGSPEETRLAMHKILVTRVQGATPTPQEGTDGAAADADTAPMHEGGMTVTLAVNARDAETIVFAVEHGTIYLSLEDPEAPVDGTRTVNRGNVYE